MHHMQASPHAGSPRCNFLWTPPDTTNIYSNVEFWRDLITKNATCIVHRMKLMKHVAFRGVKPMKMTRLIVCWIELSMLQSDKVSRLSLSASHWTMSLVYVLHPFVWSASRVCVTKRDTGNSVLCAVLEGEWSGLGFDLVPLATCRNVGRTTKDTENHLVFETSYDLKSFWMMSHIIYNVRVHYQYFNTSADCLSRRHDNFDVALALCHWQIPHSIGMGDFPWTAENDRNDRR